MERKPGSSVGQRQQSRPRVGDQGVGPWPERNRVGSERKRVSILSERIGHRQRIAERRSGKVIGETGSGTNGLRLLDRGVDLSGSPGDRLRRNGCPWRTKRRSHGGGGWSNRRWSRACRVEHGHRRDDQIRFACRNRQVSRCLWFVLDRGWLRRPSRKGSAEERKTLGWFFQFLEAARLSTFKARLLERDEFRSNLREGKGRLPWVLNFAFGVKLDPVNRATRSPGPDDLGDHPLGSERDIPLRNAGVVLDENPGGSVIVPGLNLIPREEDGRGFFSLPRNQSGGLPANFGLRQRADRDARGEEKPGEGATSAVRDVRLMVTWHSTSSNQLAHDLRCEPVHRDRQRDGQYCRRPDRDFMASAHHKTIASLLGRRCIQRRGDELGLRRAS